MSHLRKVADYWSRLAKQQGYPARSVFKLKEIDYKFRVFRGGDRVCDLGCSPGSWSMFAAEQVGQRGYVLGLDTQPLPLTVPLPPTVHIMRQDVFEWKIPPPLHRSFDVLLSDMAPNTTGIKLLDANSSHELCQQALEIANVLLKPNGTLVMKIFLGAGFSSVLRQVQASYSTTHTLKPASTRGESVETFIIAKKKKQAGAAMGNAPGTPAAPSTSSPPPSTPLAAAKSS